MADVVTTHDAARSIGTSESAGMDPRLERHRVELTGFCYRMLGSAFEAEDAVQETLVRAWRSFDRFDEDRATVRSWLYAIATNLCFDMLRSAQRRARAMDLGPSSDVDTPLGVPLPEATWVEPVPDRRALHASDDPADIALARESIRLAFVAALQQLPPRQRAVLILREVLCWKATEVARLLGTTVASVNSALQRARATLKAKSVSHSDPFQPMDKAQQRLLARYVEAFERSDVEALVSLLHEDATMSMPPFAWWLQGREAIRKAMLGTDACHGSRLVPTVASGSPAFAQYTPTPDGAYQPWALVVIDISGGRIVGTTSFLHPARLFRLFGLPLRPEFVHPEPHNGTHR